MGRLSELIVKISANSEGFRQDLKAVNAELLRTQSTVARQTQGFANLGAGLQSFGGALIGGVTLPLAAVAAGAVKTFGEIDALKKALFTIEGTAAGTEARFLKLAKAAELPGLGLEQAVRADVRLRAIGLSATLSERAILGIGKALAGAGSGAADLDETIRQFGQLASASNLTAENLKPIIERVPQAGKLLRDAFGTANAEELRKLGVTSQQVVDLLISGFEKLPPVASGIKNNLENLSQAGRLAFAELGKAIEPAANQLINFAASVVSKIPEIAKAFTDLPQPVQTAALALAGFAGVSGVGIYAIGTILGSFGQIVTGIGVIKTAFQTLAASQLVAATSAMFAFQGAVTATSVAMTALLAVPYVAFFAGLAFVLKEVAERFLALREAQNNIVDLEQKQANATKALEDRLRSKGFAVDALKLALKEGNISQLEYNQGLRGMAVELGNSLPKTEATKTSIKGIGETAKATAAEVVNLANGTGLLARETFASKVLIEARNILLSEEVARVRESAEAWVAYQRFLGGVVPAIASVSDALKNIPFELSIPKIEAPIESQSAGQIEAIKKTQAEADSVYKTSQKSLDDYNKKQRVTSQVGVEAMRQIRRATREVSDGIADAIFNGRDFGDTMTRVARNIGQNLTSFVLQKLIEATGLLKGFDRILTGVIKNAAGSAASAGINTGINAGVGAAGSAAGSAGSAASGAATAATSGLTSILGTVFGGISAASSIFGNFQQAATNKTLDLIEGQVRKSANDLANLRADEFRRKDELFSKLDSLFQFSWVKADELITSVRSIGSVANAGGSGNVNVNITGGIVFGQNAISQLADALLAEFRIRGALVR